MPSSVSVDLHVELVLSRGHKLCLKKIPRLKYWVEKKNFIGVLVLEFLFYLLILLKVINKFAWEVIDMAWTQNRLVLFKLLLQFFADKEKHVLTQFCGILRLILTIYEFRSLIRFFSFVLDIFATLPKVLWPYWSSYSRIALIFILIASLLIIRCLKVL